jgi:hypothetical protein
MIPSRRGVMGRSELAFTVKEGVNGLWHSGEGVQYRTLALPCIFYIANPGK